MGCYIASLHFTLFQNSCSCIGSIRYRRELHLLPDKTTGVQVQIIITVLHREFTVEIPVDSGIHNLHRAP